MNNKKREVLKAAKILLDRASNMVSEVLEDEEDSLDNMPENLQASERYERMEDVIDELGDTVSLINDAIDGIDRAM